MCDQVLLPLKNSQRKKTYVRVTVSDVPNSKGAKKQVNLYVVREAAKKLFF